MKKQKNIKKLAKRMSEIFNKIKNSGALIYITCDKDSIEDAMDILDSIQRANGIVGIISHVQLLRDRISTKLNVDVDSKGSHIKQNIG